MGNLSGFDASSVEPNQPRSAIPPGEYLAVISGSERVASKSGNGDLLKFEFFFSEKTTFVEQIRTEVSQLTPGTRRINASKASPGSLSALWIPVVS